MSLFSISRRWTYNMIRSSSICKARTRSDFFRQVQNKSRICHNETKIYKRYFCDKTEHTGGMKVHRPSGFDKKILVYNGSYPTVEAVPKEVSNAQMLRAKDWFRIRLNIGVTVGTFVIGVFIALYVRRLAKIQNTERHRKFQEKEAADSKES